MEKPTRPAAVAAPDAALEPEAPSLEEPGVHGLAAEPNVVERARAPRLSFARRGASPAWSACDKASSFQHSQPARFRFERQYPGPPRGLFPAWMKQAPATDVDRAALATLPKLGLVPVEVSLPNWPYDSLNLLLFAEGAAAFRGTHPQPRRRPAQSPDVRRLAQSFSSGAFPFRRRFRPVRPLPPQSRRGNARLFSQVDLLLVPSLRDEMLVISNNTGHPSLTMPRRIRRSLRSPFRLGPRPQKSSPKISPPRAFLTASLSSAASSKKAPSAASASPSNAPSPSPPSAPPSF